MLGGGRGIVRRLEGMVIRRLGGEWLGGGRGMVRRMGGGMVRRAGRRMW